MKTHFIKTGAERTLLLSLVLGLLAGCAPRTVVFTRSQLLMGHIPVNISIRTSPTRLSQATEASDKAFRFARDLEAQISEYQAGSDISCLNRNAGKTYCRISSATKELLNDSLNFSEKTDHAFDIRFASLSLAGRQGDIIFRGDFEAMLVHPETRLGVGAIGKGFIVDRILPLLAKEGFPDALIDAGGHLRAAGGPWRVAIQVPNAPPGTITEEREIKDQAWSTSGLYEQGRHILDPRTMKKIDREGSVTVLAPTLTQADALDTAFLVLGKEKAAQYSKRFPEIEVVWLEPKPSSTQ